MTTTELNAIIGRSATLAVLGVHHAVTIRNARDAYGRTDVEIEAAAPGRGRRWVSLNSVTLTETVNTIK